MLPTLDQHMSNMCSCVRCLSLDQTPIAVLKEHPLRCEKKSNGQRVQAPNEQTNKEISLGMHVIHCGSSYGEPNPPRCMNYLKSFSFVTNSCAIMPAVEIMAKRPLRISLFCSSKNAV